MIGLRVRFPAAGGVEEGHKLALGFMPVMDTASTWPSLRNIKSHGGTFAYLWQ